MTALPSHSVRRRRRGLTLAEVLIAASLMMVILLAVTAAMQATFMSYSENRKIAEVTQVSRAVLHRMMREIRTAEAVTCSAQSVTMVPPDNGDGLTQLEYVLDNGTLYYRQTVNGDVQSFPLIESGGDVAIQDFTVSRETGQTIVDDVPVVYTKRVTVRLDLKVGANAFPVTASVCPRRNLTY